MKINLKRALGVACVCALSLTLLAGCTSSSTSSSASASANADQEAADNVAALIDKIYVQTRTETTDADCAAAKAAWDQLTDAQKELVEGENADPDYFGRDTGDASKDDPLNQDGIGEKEILVVSFGTSFNDSRVQDISSIEKDIQAAYPDWSVRRAFTAQIIINHIQARDGEAIDNMEQALERAVANGVQELVVQPTHLMHGAEYDEMCETLEQYKDKIPSITISEPLAGPKVSSVSEHSADQEALSQAIVEAAVSESSFGSASEAAEAKTAFVLMGHGTSHNAAVMYTQIQACLNELGYTNVFVGTVEGEPEGTSCEDLIETIKEAGYTNVVLRPLMVVAGDHANNDMAGEDEDSWLSMFTASGAFQSVETQIEGMGSIPAIRQMYLDHLADVM